jgi:NitT/TauT family transport system substrate-binding protein
VQSMPFYLVTNNAAVTSIRDLTEKDRIAVPAVKVSSQAVCLQMAAAREWGDGDYARLDPLTITRAHPDAATAVITKSSEVTSHYAVAPYYQYELAVAGLHHILKSYDTFGGPVTNGVMIVSRLFHEQNPKACASVYAALEDAHGFINKNPGDAAQIYMTATGEKRNSRDEIAAMIADPDNVWTTVPQRSLQFLAFMHKVGTVKKLPGSWKDLYMPEAQTLAGS